MKPSEATKLDGKLGGWRHDDELVQLLRRYVCRILGWKRTSEAVDGAMRTLRMAAAGTGVLMLVGDDDLVPVARSLHRHVLGPDRPFVVCDPGRCQVQANSRGAENYERAPAAWSAATGGTLCLRRERLPKDWEMIAERVTHPAAQVRIVICGGSHKLGLPVQSLPIWVPAISDRAGDIDRLITEYAQDAFARFDLGRTSLPSTDHAWVRSHSAWSHSALEKATSRLVAVRISEDLGEAATRLGMNRIALTRWVVRRKLPLTTPCTCCSPEPSAASGDVRAAGQDLGAERMRTAALLSGEESGAAPREGRAPWWI
jgi:hypothetical protein